METLSLIDVSSEDDLLISSSVDRHRDPRSSGLAENHDDHNSFVLEPASTHEGEDLLKIRQQCEHGPEMSQSPEQKRAKFAKVNLRKSLAWDSEFFSGEGVLNTEELGIVNNTFRKTEACSLPGIQEELRRSSESTSTLDSESYTLESLEEDLFENVRASIQKSLGKGDTCTRGVPTASRLGARKKVEIPAQTKLKHPVAVKTDALSRTRLECSSKEYVLSGKEAAQPSGDSRILLKPPRIAHKPTSLQSVPSNKDLSGNVQLKNNIRRTSSGSGANRQGILAFSKTNGDARNTTSRSISSLKPNPGSHQGTVVFPTSSCLSNGSPVSSPSHSAAGKSSPFEPTRKRSAARNNDQPLHGSTTKTPGRALKSKLGPSNLGHPPTRANPTFKFSSKASPCSSIDSALSEASSSTSASIQPSNSVESFTSSTSSSPSLAVSTGADASRSANAQITSLDRPRIRKEIPANMLQSRSIARASAGTRMSSEQLNRDLARSSINGNAAPKSFRPSGLRMPSPKIGYFDSEKTLASNSNKVSQAGAKNRGNIGASDTVGGSKPKSSKIPSAGPAAQNVSANTYRPQAQSVSRSPRRTSPSPRSLRRQPQPSHAHEASKGGHGMVCEGAAEEADMHGSSVTTHKGTQATGHFDRREKHGQDGHIPDEVHSVSMKFQKENLLPDHETKSSTPVDIMEKMTSLSLYEATDHVGGD